MTHPEFSQDDLEENRESNNRSSSNQPIWIPSLNPIISKKITQAEQEEFLAWKEKADDGDPDAQLRTGFCYAEGKGVEQSPPSAFYYYNLAANQGHPGAQISLGRLYEAGIGVEQSYLKALDYYQLAAENGGFNALALIGKLYEEGKGVKKSPQEAIRYYQMAAEDGNIIALQFLANAYENGIGVKKSKEQARFYNEKIFLQHKESADQGKPEDQVIVGFFFEKGIGIDKSLKSAVHYYQLSAEQNFPRAFFLLAQCYEAGKGIEKSIEKAIHYYQLAVDGGDSLAQFALGECLIRNKTNPEKAVPYLKSVVENCQQYPELVAKAQQSLGECFEKGIGVEKSDQQALSYYLLAANGGDSSAQYRLGDIYLKGELGVEKSFEQALHYFQLAAKQGDSFALRKMGKLYEKGEENIKCSPEKAFNCYKLAAELEIKKGYYFTVFDLARCYEEGIGTEKSLETAIHYYRLAAENGHPKGYDQVACCYQKIGGDEAEKKAAIYLKMGASQAKNETDSNLSLMKKQHAFQSVEQSLTETSLKVLVPNFFPVSPKITLYGGRLSVSECQKKADKGNAKAQYEMGLNYKKGAGVEQSDEKAFEYFKLAAEQGYAKAQYEIGCSFQKGIGTLQADEQALKYFEMAADQGHLAASKKIFNSYHFGNGTAQSYEKALPYLKILTEQPSPDPIYLHCLGYYYSEGFGGLEQSDSQAFKYYKLAADLGLTTALWAVGEAYRTGQGVRLSDEKAFQYNQLAADQGNMDDQYLVEETYRKGFIVKESWDKALHYYKLAAHQGHLKAIKLLYDCYEYGKKVQESKAEALTYLQMGAQLNDAECQYNLGRYYQHGKGGLHPSFIEAIKYYKLAAAQNNQDANRHLKSINKILHPHAQLVDMSSYLSDPHIANLKALLQNYGKKPIFLNEYEFDSEEAQVLCSAMIENPHFTVICSKPSLERLFLAFELKGYQPNEDLNFVQETRSITESNFYACVFIATKKDKDLLIGVEKSFKYLNGKANDPESGFYISNFYLQEKIEAIKNNEEAFDFLKKLADQGNAEAQFYLSIFYLNGIGIEKSKYLAFQYAKLAANQGMAEAQYNLAAFYDKKIGINKYLKTCNDYLAKAAEQGLAPAQHLLGLKTKNLEHIEKAASKDYIPSLIRLGEYYLKEKPEKALNYFEKAKEQDNLDQFYERWRLENQIEFCKREIDIQIHCAKAKEIHKDLPPKAIFDLDAKQIEIDLYSQDERIKILKQMNIEINDQPFHLCGSKFSYDETILIRNAMLENPLLIVVCPIVDGHSLSEAFYRLGYNYNCLKKIKLNKINNKFLYGFLFTG